MPERKEIVAVALAIGLIGVVAAIRYALASRRLRPRLPPQRFRAAAWDGWACAFAFVLFALPPELIAKALVAVNVVPADGAAASRVYRMCVARVVVLPLQCAALVAGLRAFGVPFYQVRFGSLRRALSYGVPACVAVATATYLVNFVAILVYSWLSGRPPMEHPILEALTVRDDLAFLAVMLAESCFAAPLREELFFRGVVQPWLAKHESGWAVGIASAALAAVAFGGQHGAVPGLAFAVALVPPAVALDRWAATGLTGLVPIRQANARRRAVGAIIGTAALFATFHAAVWPSPVALFVFGLGVGWLAFRTQSLGPPLVVHVLFNAMATVSILLR